MYSHWIQHIRRTIATQIADSQSSDLHGRVQPTHARDKSNVLEANVQHNDGHILQIIDPIVPCQTSGDYYQRWRRQRRPLPHVEQLCTCTSQQQNVKCTKGKLCVQTVCKLCANKLCANWCAKWCAADNPGEIIRTVHHQMPNGRLDHHCDTKNTCCACMASNNARETRIRVLPDLSDFSRTCPVLLWIQRSATLQRSASTHRRASLAFRIRTRAVERRWETGRGIPLPLRQALIRRGVNDGQR
jgi:hypothetical protein